MKRILKEIPGRIILPINKPSTELSQWLNKNGMNDERYHEVDKPILKIFYKTNTLPYQGKRLNDRIEFIIHWVKKKDFKANTEAILQPYSQKSLERMNSNYKFSTNQKVVDGIRQTTEKKNIIPSKGGTKPSTVFGFKTAGAIKNKGEKHPAPFHPELPEFFIKWLTDKEDIVLDPFGGSFTTYKQAIEMSRNAIAFEINEDYKIFIPEKEVKKDTDDFWS